MQVTTIGLDIAKNVFLNPRSGCERPCCSAEEAQEKPSDGLFRESSGVGRWHGVHARRSFLGQGAGHVWAYSASDRAKVRQALTRAKNDANDAAAICEAVSRPQMRFVPQKTIAQQDLQCIHRVRSRLISCRTQLCNQIRGVLSEYGIEIPQHIIQVRKALVQVTDEAEPRLSVSAKTLFAQLCDELCALDERIDELEDRVVQAFRHDPLCHKIGEVEGIGPVTATAVVAAIANGSKFHNGRQFAAWLGLVPRQHSSGEKQRLLGITKRGDPCLRTLLIHGARSVVFRSPNTSDARSR